MSKWVSEQGWVCRSGRLEKNVVYVGFMDLEKAYDRVNRDAL